MATFVIRIVFEEPGGYRILNCISCNFPIYDQFVGKQFGYGGCKNRWTAKLYLGYSSGWLCLALVNLQMSLDSHHSSPCWFRMDDNSHDMSWMTQTDLRTVDVSFSGSSQSQTKSWISTDSNQFQPRVAHLSLGPFTQLVDFVLDSLHFGLYLANLLSTRDAMGMHSANHWSRWPSPNGPFRPFRSLHAVSWFCQARGHHSRHSCHKGQTKHGKIQNHVETRGNLLGSRMAAGIVPAKFDSRVTLEAKNSRCPMVSVAENGARTPWKFDVGKKWMTLREKLAINFTLPSLHSTNGTPHPSSSSFCVLKACSCWWIISFSLCKLVCCSLHGEPHVSV